MMVYVHPNLQMPCWEKAALVFQLDTLGRQIQFG